MKVLEVKNVGPIKHAKVEFGDLTILVGPQASGKSVFLQMLKLAVDEASIAFNLQELGGRWNGDVKAFMSVYLGEGADSYWGPSSLVISDGNRLLLPPSIHEQHRRPLGRMVYIPAQRVMAFTLDGWPRPSSEFLKGDPYVLKAFGSSQRSQLEDMFSLRNTSEPPVMSLVRSTIVPGFSLQIDRRTPFSRLILEQDDGESRLPFNVWSAGQRESIPLVVGITEVFSGLDLVDWLAVEEPEMGLHPQGIAAVMSLIFHVLTKEVSVCISTHSVHVLDIVWALRVLSEQQAPPEALLKMLRLDKTPDLIKMAATVLEKKVSAYFFDRESGKTRDISRLDPSGKGEAESGWGGLTEWSARVGDAVADAVAAARAK